MTKPHPRGLTYDEVAHEFGYHRRTLERAAALPRSNPKHLRVDMTARPHRITRNEVLGWIQRNTK